MKGSTITAMILAAAAASAATIVALKKAYDKRHLEEALCDDWEYDPEEEISEEDFEEVGTEEAESAAAAEEEAETTGAETGCCKDGVCSLDLENDDTADQPAQLHMSDDADETASDNAEKV